MGLTQRDCDALAKELSGDDIRITIAVQGVNSAADAADFVKREYPEYVSVLPDDTLSEDWEG